MSNRTFDLPGTVCNRPSLLPDLFGRTVEQVSIGDPVAVAAAAGVDRSLRYRPSS